DMWPVTDRNGHLYIASDEANKEYNLYTIENGKKRSLTNFETSIGRPQVSADGSMIVFTRDYQVWTYNVTAKKPAKCDIRIYATETLKTEIPYTTAGKITAFDISDDGKKVSFVSRGRIFVSDLQGKFVREIPTAGNERVIEVRWMKDNASLLYTRTVKGWANIFTVNAENPDAEKQLTASDKTVQNIILSPEGDRALYVSGSSNINLINLKNFEVTSIINDEFWFRVSQPRFSPDGRYIVFTSYRNFEEDISVYDIREKKIISITNNGVSESDPFWSPDGRYIYLSADRYNPGFPRGAGVSKIYRIPLFRFSEGFRSDEYVKLFAKKTPKDTVNIDIRFDTEGIDDRWEQITVKGNEQSSPNVFTVKGKTLLLFNNSPNPQERVLTKVEMAPFDPLKSEKIGDKPFSQLEEAGGKFYALISGDIHEVKVAENKTEKLNLNADFSKNLNDEFVQMFYENWATLAEFYYDVSYHGVDWTGIRSRYEAFLPFLRNRENLKTLQNDMLGELNSSHLGFSSQGDEAKTFYKMQTNATGIIFSETEPFLVERWVKKSPVDLLDSPLKPGDELVAVNNVPVNKAFDRDLAFALPRLEKELILRFSRKGKEFEMKVNPVSSSAMKALLYDEWIAANQKKVDEATGSR
ncbi:MAG: PD40 domain-containing protein, partial [Bacteroidales bacterium]|nr:PD40 domain-containing protein [Bacteroidales bacterium]